MDLTFGLADVANLAVSVGQLVQMLTEFKGTQKYARDARVVQAKLREIQSTVNDGNRIDSAQITRLSNELDRLRNNMTIVDGRVAAMIDDKINQIQGKMVSTQQAIDKRSSLMDRARSFESEFTSQAASGTQYLGSGDKVMSDVTQNLDNIKNQIGGNNFESKIS